MEVTHQMLLRAIDALEDNIQAVKRGPIAKQPTLVCKPRKRGAPASQRGISTKKVRVSTAIVRSGGSFIEPVYLSRMSGRGGGFCPQRTSATPAGSNSKI